MTDSLKSFSTAQLLEELARREEARARRKPVDDWCDDCRHFVPWGSLKGPRSEMPDDYNPCSKGHQMSFREPETMADCYGNSGFYRRVCVDRMAAETNK